MERRVAVGDAHGSLEPADDTGAGRGQMNWVLFLDGMRCDRL